MLSLPNQPVSYKGVKYSDLYQYRDSEAAKYAVRVHAMKVWQIGGAFFSGSKASAKFLASEMGVDLVRVKA